jgi:MFS family permease
MIAAAKEKGRKSGADHPTPPTAQVVVITMIVQVMVTICTVGPSAIAPEIARAFSVPASLIGFQVSIVYLGAIITSGVGGLPIKRWGALRTSQLALAFGGLGMTLMTVPLLASLALGSLLVGFGYGLTNPAASHLLMRVTRPEMRNLVFSLKQTSVPLGAVATGLAAPTLALDFGWQSALLVASAASFAIFLAIQPFRCGWDADRDPTVPLRQNPAGDFNLAWRDPALRPVSMTGFCYSAVQLCLTTFTVTMLVEELGFGLVAAGVAFSVVQVSGVSGRLIWGGVADHLRDGNRVLMMTGAVAAAAGLMTMFLGTDAARPVVYGALILFGASAIGWNGVFMAEVARLAPADRIGSATGGVMVTTYAGVLVGPVSFAGAFALTGHYTITFGFCAAASLIGISAVIVARCRMARP